MAMCRVERLPQSSDDSAAPLEASEQAPALLALDGNALANLEVSGAVGGHWWPVHACMHACVHIRSFKHARMIASTSLVQSFLEPSAMLADA